MGQEHGVNVWAGRVCVMIVLTLGWLGFYFANIRFLPLAAGFAILAGVCYTFGRGRIAEPGILTPRHSRPQHTIV